MAKHATTNQHITLPPQRATEDLWSRHSAAWRSTAQVTSQWQDAENIDPVLLKYTVRGQWWQTLAALDITLIIGREYEHLLVGMCCNEAPCVSFMPMPHPSGVAVDRKKSLVYVASTRNPNQVYDLMPIDSCTERLDLAMDVPEDHPLVPIRSRFLPGCLYMHDLALVNGDLHANAVGHNAVVRLNEDGSYKRVWWPSCIETDDGPLFGQNYIQLNSIAAGRDLKSSFFSASSDKISNRRPGHLNYPVDGRGVIFSGATRDPIARGLTRPHSARLDAKHRLFVDNSGYGEFGLIEEGRFQPVTRLPGWTRGLAFCQGVAFVGTSRVIPRFSQYAPGLDVNASLCGVHAIELKSGQVLGSLIWPYGNQIFAIDWLSRKQTGGFPMKVARQNCDLRALFIRFRHACKSG